MNSIADAMRDMANRIYAFVIGLSISLWFVASAGGGPLRIANDGWFGLFSTALFWLFLWSEWLWVERFFMRHASGKPLRSIVEFACCVGALNVLVACYVLYQRGAGPPNLTHLYDMWQFWFALYLGMVVVSARLAHRGPISPILDCINVGVVALFTSVWLLDLGFHFGYDKTLANYMLVYFGIAGGTHLLNVVLLEMQGANNAVQ